MAWVLTKIAFREVFRRKSQAVFIIISLMISTAVITGSLIVGDSMEQLVYISTFENLGEVDSVVQANEFFEYSYFNALFENQTVTKMTDGLAPVILIKSSIEAEATGLRDNKAQLIGFDSNLYTLGQFNDHKTGKRIGFEDLDLGRNDVIINSKLAERIGVNENDAVKLIIPNPSFKLDNVFSESIGSNSIEITVTIKLVVDHSNLGRLQLDGRSQYTANIFMGLSRLQNILGIGNKINTVLISNQGDKYSGYEHEDKVNNVIGHCLDAKIGYKELGYKFNISGSDYLRITHKDVFFDTELYELLEKLLLSQPGKFDVSPIMTYFVNSITNLNSDKMINYSIITGLQIETDSAFGDFNVIKPINTMENRQDLGLNEISILNWTAEQLNAEVGDIITIEYMVLDRLYNIHNITYNFTVKNIITLSGKATDKFLMPAFPGLEGRVDCVNWEPPFPIDLNRISKNDRDFWFENSGTPKAYISLTQAQELWSNNLGSLTMIKAKYNETIQTQNDLRTLNAELGDQLNSSIDHTYAGFVIDTVKSDALDTAAGMSIFPMMFLSFGSVIILACIVLIIIIFLILVDERKYELGMLRSIGFTRQKIMNIFVFEGIIYGIIAGVIGSIIGIALGSVLVLALNSIWSEAVQAFNVPFYFKPSSIILGFIIGLIVTVFTVFFAARYCSKQNITSLLYDLPETEEKMDRRMIKLGSVLIALSLLLILVLPFVEYMNINEYLPYFLIIGFPILFLGIILLFGYTSADKKRKEFRLKYFSIIFTVVLILITISFSNTFKLPAIDQFFISGLFFVLFFVVISIVFFNSIARSLSKIFQVSTRPSVVAQYALRNPTRRLNRTALTITIFTLVIFLLVALSINNAIQRQSVDVISIQERGGYDILGESSIPIAIDLENRTERIANNIDSSIFDLISITELKLVGPPGGTCSNMNVRYPPRLLGVGPEFIMENKFRFMDAIIDSDSDRDIWNELYKSSADNNGKVPIVVDYNTLVWIYGGELGGIYEITDEGGKTIQLEVIGILENTIFGGTFVMSQENLEILYPKTAEYQYLLFKLNPGVKSSPEKIAKDLERVLEPYGVDAQAIGQLIIENRGYERSFMSLFQAFLGLGLVIGIIGLGTIMARAIHERRYEIGVLRVHGFTKWMVLKSLIIEMSFISLFSTILGLFIGIMSSYLAFGSWTGENYQFILPWPELGLLLIIIYLLTLLTAIFPALKASKLPPAEALRWVG